MELPVVREASEDERRGGRVCRQCRHWLQYLHSYGEGVCVLGGVTMTPRWSEQVQTCDGWKKGDGP
jgi:hypothetical protein